MPADTQNLLCIDIGNTNVVAAITRGDRLVFERTPSDLSHGADFFARWLRKEIEGDIDGAIVSSVVPKLGDELTQAIQAVYNVTPMQLSCKLRLDMPILIKNPAELGADLIAGAVGALQYFRPPCVVIDLGTATKFSVLDAHGCYLGCAIMPGVTRPRCLKAFCTSRPKPP